MKSRFLWFFSAAVLFLAGFYFIPFWQQSKIKVLSARDEQASLRIFAEKSYFESQNGLIPLTINQEPAVNVEALGQQGMAQVSVFRAGIENVLDFLKHDGEYNQVNDQVDTGKMNLVKVFDQEIDINKKTFKVVLPLEEIGIFYVNIKTEKASQGAFVIRSRNAAVLKEGDNELIVWGQDLFTKLTLNAGKLKIYNLKDEVRQIDEVGFAPDGIAKIKVAAEAEIGVLEKDGDYAILPINLKNLVAYNSLEFLPKAEHWKYYVFADRPLYKPGDTVYFKSIIRQDDDARYALASGKAHVRLYKDYQTEENLVLEKTLDITADSTINSDFQLPEALKTGSYLLDVSIPNQDQAAADLNWDDWSNGQTTFQVEYYQKPEYHLEIETTEKYFINNDQASFTLKGTFFSGQPIANKEVDYTIYYSDFSDYNYRQLKDFENQEMDLSGYWQDKKFDSGKARLDENGEAVVQFKPTISDQKNKIFFVEAKYADESGVPVVAQKNMLVYAGQLNVFQTDDQYSLKIGQTAAVKYSVKPLQDATVANVQLKAKIHRSHWKRVDVPGEKYPKYEKESDDLEPVDFATDAEGNAELKFPVNRPGSYEVKIQLADAQGNKIAKTFDFWVADGNGFYYQPAEEAKKANQLQMEAEKEEYAPGQNAVLNISSVIPNRDLLLTLERGRVNRYQVIHLQGNSTVVQLPLVETDMPNIFANVSSFSDDDLDQSEVEIKVTTGSKKINLQLQPVAKQFGPGENITVNIKTTDQAGNPLAANVAFWAMDKALLELSDSQEEKAFDFFWKDRYNQTSMTYSLQGIGINMAEQGGCFASGTQVLMADGAAKSIENVQPGEMVKTRKSLNDSTLVAAEVLAVHEHDDFGYLLINGRLKITPDHRIYANGDWVEAAQLKIGDQLVTTENQPELVQSIEWQKGQYKVYNLTIKDRSTFFAQGLWVHNQKGGGEVRSVFKDTAYWNANVNTDQNGQAAVTFKLPDNLTTWVLQGIAATKDTRIGQAQQEVMVKKAVVIRPIVTDFLREGDEVEVAALLHNFTDAEHDFRVGFHCDCSDKEYEVQDLVLQPNQSQELRWRVKPEKVAEKSKLNFSAIAKDNESLADVVELELPVLAFGFWDSTAQVGDGAVAFDIKLHPDSNPEQTNLKLTLAASLLGTLPDAMKYLADYPYGCVEQTTSRFVPAIIAKQNPQLFQAALANKNLDDMIQKGVSRLAQLQNDDGGWGWWHGASNPFITSYVTEYLLQARQSGIEVPEVMLNGIRQYVQNTMSDTDSLKNETNVALVYTASLLDEESGQEQITDFNDLTSDLVALAVMSNVKNGFNDPKSNGLNQLLSLAQQQDDQLYWKAGTMTNFGSNEASTALAMRAIIKAKGNRETVVKAARYLLSNRQAENWHNTFATAQVLAAAIEFTRSGQEINPDYTFSVLLDDQEVLQGKIQQFNQIASLDIPFSRIKKDGSQLRVEKIGQGQLYSTLIVKEFRTDRQASAEEQGLRINRSYFREKNATGSIKAGEVVTVELQIENPTNQSGQYMLVEDVLPAGLVAINQHLKNEDYNYKEPKYWMYQDFEITRTGVTFALERGMERQQTLTYQARVVNEGKFTVPPARVSLMYNPEIKGQTAVQNFDDAIKTNYKKDPSQLDRLTAIKEDPTPWILRGLLVLILLMIGFWQWKMKNHPNFNADIFSSSTATDLPIKKEPIAIEKNIPDPELKSADIDVIANEVTSTLKNNSRPDESADAASEKK